MTTATRRRPAAPKDLARRTRRDRARWAAELEAEADRLDAAARRARAAARALQVTR